MFKDLEEDIYIYILKALMKTVKIQTIDIPKIFKEMKIELNKEIESLTKSLTKI